jgi:hypothetical protein
MLGIKLDNGHTYELPGHASDITFRQFIDMRSTEQAFYEDGSFGYGSIPTVLAAIYGDDFVNSLDMYMPPNAEELRPIQPEFLTLESEVDTLSVYNHTLAVIESFEPTSADNVIKYRGEEYVLLVSDILKGDGKVKVSSGVVALELAAHFQALIETKGDIEGNYAFTLGLLEVATLARKRDELLPLNKNERERWLQERGKLFENLPLSEVLKVRFFFLRILRGSVKTLSMRLSGKYQASQSPKHQKSIKQRPKRKRFPLKKVKS